MSLALAGVLQCISSVLYMIIIIITSSIGPYHPSHYNHHLINIQ